jgi:hypothetical protein
MLAASMNRGSILPSQAALVGAACAIAVGLVAVVQVLHLGELMDADMVITAGHADRLVIAYALAALAIVAAAAFLPARMRWIPVAGAATVVLAALAATLLVGGELWSFAFALVTMAACWRIGSWVLGAVGAAGLARRAPAAWLAGVGVLGIALLLLGRAGLLFWWTVGAATLVLGLLGLAGLGRLLAAGRAGKAWSAVTSTPLGAASAALCLLSAALASVWVAAPELMFDSLYFKVWLPSEWARTGEIEPLALHPYLNLAGTAQLLAIPGHTVGVEGVGRYMQWLAVGALAATVWWTARRSPWAPLAAAAIALTPMLFWQATTAFDDGILALGAVALAVAVVTALREPEESTWAVAGALGAMAGALIALKLHLAPIALGLAVGWLLVRGRPGWGTALVALALGGLLTAAPPLIVRWLDVGNPVLPYLNNVFESPHWPASQGVSLPPATTLLAAALAVVGAWFLFQRGRAWGAPLIALVAAAVLGFSGEAEGIASAGLPTPKPVDVLWDTIVDPRRLRWTSVGAFGLLSLATAVALLLCWRRGPGGRATLALWCGVAVGATAWYATFPGGRYLLPTGAVAVLVIALASGVRPPGPWLERLGLAGLAVTAVLLWPATVAQFWNVPGKGIPWKGALGLISDGDYEREATPNRDLLAEFDRLAPAGALALSDPHERLWLTDGRDLAPMWEVHGRLKIDGSPPTEPAETLAEVRAAGVSWVVVSNSNSQVLRPDYLRRMIETRGIPVFSSDAGTIYRLPGGADR